MRSLERRGPLRYARGSFGEERTGMLFIALEMIASQGCGRHSSGVQRNGTWLRPRHFSYLSNIPRLFSHSAQLLPQQ